MNHVELSARIVALQAQRYTPAGLPAIEFTLEHESSQVEAGAARQVQASVEAVAIGTVAEQIATRPVGSAGLFKGFLAKARRGRHPRLHVQEFKFESPQI